MSSLIRALIYVSLLVILGVGVRLMYYGLQTVVGASPNGNWLNLLALLVGVAVFISGIVTGILFLSPSARN